MKYVIEYYMPNGGKIARGFAADEKVKWESAVTAFTGSRKGAHTWQAEDEGTGVMCTHVLPLERVATIRAYEIPDQPEGESGK